MFVMKQTQLDIYLYGWCMRTVWVLYLFKSLRNGHNCYEILRQLDTGPSTAMPLFIGHLMRLFVGKEEAQCSASLQVASQAPWRNALRYLERDTSLSEPDYLF
jgi:hypothetical protein